jgi:hypothetical protein
MFEIDEYRTRSGAIEQEPGERQEQGSDSPGKKAEEKYRSDAYVDRIHAGADAQRQTDGAQVIPQAAGG